MATRSFLREKIMIILYQYDLMKSNGLDCDIEDIIKDNMDVENDFVKDMVYGVITCKDELDKLANSKMKDWDISKDYLQKTKRDNLRGMITRSISRRSQWIWTQDIVIDL